MRERDDADSLDDALLEELRLLRDELGVPPRTIDMGKHGKFSPALYSDRFGSWENALRNAGIDGEPRRPPEDTEVNLEEKREYDVTERQGERKTSSSVDNDPGDEMGVDGRVSDDDLDEHQRLLLRNAERVEGVPTPDDLRERGHPVNEIIDEYGTWEDALASVGIEVENTDKLLGKRTGIGTRSGRLGGKEQRLLNEIQKYEGIHGRVPTEADIDSSNWMSPVVEYREAFGSVWRAVDRYRLRQESGEDIDTDTHEKGPSEGDLVNELKLYYLRKGDVPRREDVRKDETMSDFSCYINVFGDMRAAIDAAGLSKYSEKEAGED